MSHSNLTRWIEDAEARQVLETAQVGRGWTVSENHYLDLGRSVMKVPFWPHHGGTCESLVTLGCHALSRVRHPLARKAA